MAIKNILGNPNVRNYIAATKQPVNVMNTNKRGSASIVIDTRCASTRRLYQSSTATR